MGTSRIKRIRYIAIAVLTVSLLTSLFLLLKDYEDAQSTHPVQSGDVLDNALVHGGTEYELKDGIETFLLLGLDTLPADFSSDKNNQAADSIVLLVFDNNSSTVTPMQINRDTMVRINKLDIFGEKTGITFSGQISISHQYGNGKEVSCRNVADSLSDMLLGVKIKHFASVVMDAVPVYNDMVGGVTLTVMDDFSAVDSTLVKGEEITLNGEQALTYVKARQGMEDSSNVARMARQRQYMQALYNKTKECVSGDSGFTAKVTTSLSKYIVSDCTVYQLQKLLEKATSYTVKDTVTLEGESVKGEQYMEFYPDNNALKETVISLFYTPKK